MRLLFLLLLLPLAGCWSSSPREVVVYAALDREFSEPILQQYERETGVRVLVKYDVESTKTVGLTEAIINEKKRPRCDLFWNNEIVQTLRLQRLGLLAPYDSAVGKSFPKTYRSPTQHWFGLAARTRVLLVNTDRVSPDQEPDSIEDLVAPRWKGQVAIAKPLFGTTATQAAVLYHHWGEQRAEKYFAALKENAHVLSGNKQVAMEVSAGRLAFGLTDTDDAMVEIDRGAPVKIVFPDQGEDQAGALFIPNTLALLRNSPNRQEAEKLLDYLLSPPVEKQLARGRSAQFPLNPAVETVSRAQGEAPLKRMETDFPAAAEKWDETARRLREMFNTAD